MPDNDTDIFITCRRTMTLHRRYGNIITFFNWRDNKICKRFNCELSLLYPLSDYIARRDLNHLELLSMIWMEYTVMTKHSANTAMSVVLNKKRWKWKKWSLKVIKDKKGETVSETLMGYSLHTWVRLSWCFMFYFEPILINKLK